MEKIRKLKFIEGANYRDLENKIEEKTQEFFADGYVIKSCKVETHADCVVAFVLIEQIDNVWFFSVDGAELSRIQYSRQLGEIYDEIQKQNLEIIKKEKGFDHTKGQFEQIWCKVKNS